MNECPFFQYLCVYISAKKEDYHDNSWRVKKGMICCLLSERVKLTVLLWADEIPSEYSNSRILLMAKVTLQLEFARGPQKFMDKIILFQYSYTYISVKKRIYG